LSTTRKRTRTSRRTTWLRGYELFAADALMQLAAGGVRLAASGVAHGHVQTLRRDLVLEPPDRGAVRRVERRVLDRIERNEVDVRELALQQRAQLVRVAVGVVDACQHHPLEADAPSGLFGIAVRRFDEVVHGVLAI